MTTNPALAFSRNPFDHPASEANEYNPTLPEGVAHAAGEVLRSIDAARELLVGINAKNPFLNFKLSRTRGVEIVGESPAALCELLISQNKRMTFAASIAADGIEGPGGESTEGLSQPDGQYYDTVINTAHTDSDLQARLLRTANQARSDRDDKGLHTLQLVLGYVNWKDGDGVEHRAPLAIMPVTIQRSGVQGRFWIEHADMPVQRNHALAIKLRREFGITLPEISGEGKFDFETYAKEVEAAISGQPTLILSKSECAISLLSFEGALLYHELDSSRWPTGRAPENSPLVQRFFGGIAVDPVTTQLQPSLSVTTHPLVVPADNSQIPAVTRVAAGEDLVIIGPPGTGKSQVITNLISSLVSSGKKILFVSSKAAAISVVERNLQRAGIGDIALSLHSDDIPRSQVVESLRNAIELGRPVSLDSDKKRESVRSLERELHGYQLIVSTPIDGRGISFHDAVGKLTEIFTSTAYPRGELRDLSNSNVGRLTTDQYQQCLEASRQLEAVLSTCGDISSHAFVGSTLQSALLPSERSEGEQKLHEMASRLEGLHNDLKELFTRLGIDSELSAGDLVKTIRALELIRDSEGYMDVAGSVNFSHPAWKSEEHSPVDLLRPVINLESLHEAWRGRLTSSAWGSEDVEEIARKVESFSRSWFYWASPDYWRVRTYVASLFSDSEKRSWDGWRDALTAIKDAQVLRSEIDNPQRRATLTAVFGDSLAQSVVTNAALATSLSTFGSEFVKTGHGLKSFEGLISVLHVPDKRNQLTDSLSPLADRVRGAVREVEVVLAPLGFRTVQFGSRTIPEEVERMRRMAREIDSLEQIVAVNEICRAFEDFGVTIDREIFTDWTNAATRFVRSVEFTWLSALVADYLSLHPELTRASGLEMNGKLLKHEVATTELFDSNSHGVATAHWSGKPRAGMAGQSGYLFNEISKTRNYRPNRELFEEAGAAVQAVKPVIMASPSSLARLISPSAPVEFDVLIIDEASQVPPEEAIGALARVKQVVVVGDNRQMPPYRPFASGSEEDEDEETPLVKSAESILDVALRRGISSVMLTHHRRSRDPSLIRTSSELNYGGALKIYPSPRSAGPDRGLCFQRVEGAIYEAGRSGANRKEAEVVADLIIEHTRKYPERSIGAAGLNLRQADAILLEVEKRLKREPELYKSLYEGHKDRPFFVRNLQNIQGDERDSTFVGLGFGRDAKGKFSQNFGPLNTLGGERRLNVLMTRARLYCKVVASFDPEDLEVEGKADGIRHLQTYLYRARDGAVATAPAANTDKIESPVQSYLRRELEAHGLNVETNVGDDGCRIDLVVFDAHDMTRGDLAVLFDGAAPSAGDIEGERLTITPHDLSAMGWKTHVVWTMDLLNNPRQVVDTIVAKVRASGDAEKVWSSSPQKEIVREEARSQERDLSVTLYKKASPKFPPGQKFRELTAKQMADLIRQVVQTESPIHISEVLYRLRGDERPNNSVQETFNTAVTLAGSNGWVTVAGEFLHDPASKASEFVRSRRSFASSRKSIEFVPPEEIRSAIDLTIKTSFGVRHSEIAEGALAALGLNSESETNLAAMSAYVNETITTESYRISGEWVFSQNSVSP